MIVPIIHIRTVYTGYHVVKSADLLHLARGRGVIGKGHNGIMRLTTCKYMIHRGASLRG